jgi:S-layer protein (TIGR01567 family)
MVVRSDPGTYEVRGTVYNETELVAGFGGAGPVSWNAQSFAAFYYDSKDNLGTENLNAVAIDSTNDKILKNDLWYNTSAQPKQLKVVSEQYTGDSSAAASAGLDRTAGGQAFEGGNYYIIGWQAQPYVALNGKVDKLAKLIIEQGTAASEKKTLQVGETWDVGGGWTLTANSIDAKATPRQVWLTLSKDGVKKDDKVVSSGTNTSGAKPVYTYVEKSIAGETDVPMFVTYVDSVFAGATSDMVQLRYTWAVSTSVTQVKSSDTYGIFKDASISGKNISLKNSDTDVSLTRDSTQDLMGNMKFRVADSPVLRFYPKVDYEISGGEITPTVTGTGVGPTVTATAPTNVTAVPTTGVTAVTAVGTTEKPPTPAATGTPKEPGFEVTLAVTGLLAVAFLVLRQRK